MRDGVKTERWILLLLTALFMSFPVRVVWRLSTVARQAGYLARQKARTHKELAALLLLQLPPPAGQPPSSAACNRSHTLAGADKMEPRVLVCLDQLFAASVATPTTDAEGHHRDDRSSSNCIVYSIGIADNWIIDDWMLSQGCEVFSFDPSMSGYTHRRHPTRHHFEALGIGTHVGTHNGKSTLYGGQKDYPVSTLDDIMSRLGHQHLSAVRLDCEGCEWDVLQQWLDEGWMSRIDQLLLEIHLSLWTKRSPVSEDESVRELEWQAGVLRRLAQAFTLIHSELNKHEPMVTQAGLGRVRELGWLRKRHLPQ